MDSVKKYILDHYNEYGFKLGDKPITKDDMTALLNILEAHNENLDSLHDVAFNGYDEFCGICGRFDNDNDTVNALFDFNVFISDSEWLAWVKAEVSERLADEWEPDWIVEDIKNTVVKTSDGFVMFLEY